MIETGKLEDGQYFTTVIFKPDMLMVACQMRHVLIARGMKITIAYDERDQVCSVTAHYYPGIVPGETEIAAYEITPGATRPGQEVTMTQEDRRFIATSAQLEDPFADVTPFVDVTPAQLATFEDAIHASILAAVERDTIKEAEQTEAASAGRFLSAVTVSCMRCGTDVTAHFDPYQSPIQIQATIDKLLSGPCPRCYVEDTGDYESVEAAGLDTQELQDYEGLSGADSPDIDRL